VRFNKKFDTKISGLKRTMRGLKHRERNKDSEEEDLEENLKANHQLSSIYINKMFSMVIFYYSSDLVMRG